MLFMCYCTVFVYFTVCCEFYQLCAAQLDCRTRSQQRPRRTNRFTRRSRLIYESKKRGILENDIILGQFAEQRLEALDRPTVEAYDKLIYGSDMECDLYYYLSGKKPTPAPCRSRLGREWREVARGADDLFGSAARAEIAAAVDFIESVTSQGKTVYVHCKAGHTRSVTIATCYLMKSINWLPNVAFEFLKSQRPQVLLRSAHWRTANEYRRFLDRQSPLQSK